MSRKKDVTFVLLRDEAVLQTGNKKRPWGRIHGRYTERMSRVNGTTGKILLGGSILPFL